MFRAYIVLLAHQALAGQVPAATFGNAELQTAEAPEPTPAPYLAMELLRRDSSPTSLCGYVAGNAASAQTCNNNGFCGINPNLRAYGCCDTALVGGSLTDCHFYTTCLDASKFSASCGAACQSNILNGWCTRAGNAYCQTYLSSGYSGYLCGSAPGTYNLLPTPTNNNVAVSTTPRTTEQSASTTRVVISSTTAVVVPSTTRPPTTSGSPIVSSTTSSPGGANDNSPSTTPYSTMSALDDDDDANSIGGASYSQSQLTVGGSGVDFSTILPTTTSIAQAGQILHGSDRRTALSVVAALLELAWVV